MENNDDSKIFKCIQCGTCCSHIRGMMPKEDKEFIKEMAFGKLPLVQLVPIEKMSFPLFDWEAKRFIKWQKKAGVDGKIKPLRAVFDLKSNKAIIVTYFIDSDSCPFLKNNKCSIYDEKRAYICRMFPFNRGPYIKTGEKPLKEDLFGSCTGMKKLMPHIPEHYDGMVKFLSGSFPDGSFENVLQFDYITEWVNRIIVDLIKKKVIRPAMNYPYDFLIKRINNAEKIDFTDFLAESGYIANKEEMIKGFDENKDAKTIKTSKFINE